MGRDMIRMMCLFVGARVVRVCLHRPFLILLCACDAGKEITRNDKTTMVTVRVVVSTSVGSISVLLLLLDCYLIGDGWMVRVGNVFVNCIWDLLFILPE